jgi:NAD+ diphosphatase
MIQDIAPHKLWNQFEERIPNEDSLCIICREGSIMIKADSPRLILPTYSQVKDFVHKTIYLFRVDELEYFLIFADELILDGYDYFKIRAISGMPEKATAFAIMTGYHLYVWYRDNQFCGRCGNITVPDHKERMLLCGNCGNMIFPKICPAIIVGVIDGDRLLMTRYSGRPGSSYALIAGFMEIGETPEDTVRREVMEEVGVKVKNIRYFTSQPWGVDSDLLLGYFAELVGSDEIHIDEHELSYGNWFKREDIHIEPNDISMTNYMIQAFYNNNFK